MERVTGIGGIFFKARDPTALFAWYAAHLGITEIPGAGCAIFRWSDGDGDGDGGEGRSGKTVWAPFAQDTDYFAPSPAPFMVNYRVADLDRMLAQLRAAGVPMDERIEESDFGRFGWGMDPEGNRFELWEPPP